MLDTLEGSIAAQRQLVADASHELRTPVTSLRTNIEVLAESELDPAERARLIADVQAQAEELSALVADLIELARGDQPAPELEDVRLDALVAEAIERAPPPRARRRVHRGSSSPWSSRALPDRLARAINNLLDNAARHTPPAHRRGATPAPTGSACATTATGIDRRRTSRTSSTASTAAPTRARPPGHRPRPGDRAPGGRAARRAVSAANAPGGGAVFGARGCTPRKAPRARAAVGAGSSAGLATIGSAPAARSSASSRCPTARRRSSSPLAWAASASCRRSPTIGASAPGLEAERGERAHDRDGLDLVRRVEARGPSIARRWGARPRCVHSGSA